MSPPTWKMRIRTKSPRLTSLLILTCLNLGKRRIRKIESISLTRLIRISKITMPILSSRQLCSEVTPTLLKRLSSKKMTKKENPRSKKKSNRKRSQKLY